MQAEGWQVWFPLGWGWGSTGPVARAQPCPPPQAASTCCSPTGTAGQDAAGSTLPPRGQAPGRCLDRDRSSCRAWAGILNPGTAKAGARVTPTLRMGTLRLSGYRDLAGSQGSEAAEPGGPGLACWRPPCLHSGACPHRPPEWLSSISLGTLIQMALSETCRGSGCPHVSGLLEPLPPGHPAFCVGGTCELPLSHQLQLHWSSLSTQWFFLPQGLCTGSPVPEAHTSLRCVPPPQRGPP